MTLETLSTNKGLRRRPGRLPARLAETGTDMTFSVFVPPQAEAGAKLPVVWYLSGLTCTHANVTEKGEYRNACAELGLIFVAPDTSPRGPDVPDDEAYDFGQGAGFYVDATEPPFDRNYRMESYVTSELPGLIAANFPADMDRQGITGHSMGGHGALTLALCAIPAATAASPPSRRSSRRRWCRGARRRSAAISGPIAPPGARTTRSP